MNEPILVILRELLVKEFSEEELAALCQDVGLNYADLPGMGPYGKTREIIEAVQARHAIPALMSRVRDLRPDAYQTAGLPDPEPDASAAAPATATGGAGLSSGAATGGGLDDMEPYHPPSHIGEPAGASEAGRTPLSALSPRVRAIAIVVVAVLVLAALLTVILPKPAASPLAAPTATAVGDAGATAAVVPTTAVEANVAVTSDVALTDTVVVTAPLPTADASTAVPATQTANQSHPAALAVKAINDQLLEFYAGKVTADTIKPNWGTKTYQVVINFAYKTLKTRLGIDLTKGGQVKVDMHYDQDPALVSENGNTAIVSTREYWGYTNPSTNRAICDTRDYTYTLAKNGDSYQVTNLTSKVIASKCQ